MSNARRVIEQSAVIPYRVRAGAPEVLLITSSDGRRWGVPKGLLEPGMTPAESAAKEALEEAGVLGQVVAGPLGTYDYEKWGATCRVEVFLLRVDEVLDAWDEPHRQRAWLGVEEAAARVSPPGLAALIRGVTPG
jgi:phosphohistidine phosphatase